MTVQQNRRCIGAEAHEHAVRYLFQCVSMMRMTSPMAASMTSWLKDATRRPRTERRSFSSFELGEPATVFCCRCRHAACARGADTREEGAGRAMGGRRGRSLSTAGPAEPRDPGRGDQGLAPGRSAARRACIAMRERLRL